MEKSDETSMKVIRHDAVVELRLNRPGHSNSLPLHFWVELKERLDELKTDFTVRALIITASGRNFSAGLDCTRAALDYISSYLTGDAVKSAATLLGAPPDRGMARRALEIRQIVAKMQETFTSFEQLHVPVIAAVNGACVGGGVDLITACDVRLCASDAYFCVKEIDLGLAADLGTLQRLPKVVGNQSFVNEVCFTGRNIFADEARRVGLVSEVLPSTEKTRDRAIQLATLISTKSPIAVSTIKRVLLHGRDHSVAEGLDYVLTWNQAMLQSKDVTLAMDSIRKKSPPIFSNL